MLSYWARQRTVTPQLQHEQACGMATPASRTLTPRAPEKGVFPLDHFGECKEARRQQLSRLLSLTAAQEAVAYLVCLQNASFATEACRHLSKSYLECRMKKYRHVLPLLFAPQLTLGRRGLMVEEDLSKLGFSDKKN